MSAERERLVAAVIKARHDYHMTSDGIVGNAVEWNVWIYAENALAAFDAAHPEAQP